MSIAPLKVSHDDVLPDGQEAEARAPGLKPRLLERRAPRDAEADDLPDFDDPLLTDDEPPRRSGWRRAIHPFVLFVLLPTLLVAGFEYLVAADQYQSSAQFIVRTPQQNGAMSGLGEMLGLEKGSAAADAHSVDAYLLSHDAVKALGHGRLIAMFRHPEADIVSKLRPEAPTPETLLKYFQKMVHVTTASETGITTLTVRAYRPIDAKTLADDLLRLGETRVNRLNQRMFDDGLAASTRQVREAEANAGKVQAQITRFRQTRRDADPLRSSQAQIQMASTLQQQAALARAEFQAMAGGLPRSAPQYRAMSRRVAAMEAQVGTAKAGLAGSAHSVAAGLGDYEDLQMRQQFAVKQLEVAHVGYQASREQLMKQQLFVVPVVEPNMPVKSLFPQRLTIIATAFMALVFAYAIGWLILVGVREHAE